MTHTRTKAHFVQVFVTLADSLSRFSFVQLLTKIIKYWSFF